MKKIKFFSGMLFAAVALLAGCTSDEYLGESPAQGNASVEAPISFAMHTGNMHRADAKKFQDAGRYNFGVWAVKTVGGTADPQLVFDNYLVGYYDAKNKKGYNPAGITFDQNTFPETPATYPTTDKVEDGTYLEDNVSNWFYEGLGSSQYKWAANDESQNEAYYLNTQEAFMSNLTEQYAKYWDKSSTAVTFYGYAPYTSGTDKVTFDTDKNSATYLHMTFPNNIVGGKSPAANEFLWARTTVDNGDYGKDVKLQFQRFSAKLRIAFWEDIPGWKVKVLNLSDTYNKGVYAQPVDKNEEAGTYSVGKLINSCSAVLDLSKTPVEIELGHTGAAEITKAISFAVPVDLEDEGEDTKYIIGTERDDALFSPECYYPVPTKAGQNSGLLFYVTFQMIEEHTGETITVRNARVYVPADATKFDPNKVYTYYFKITTGTNGTTGPEDPDPDPENPEVPEDPALSPIVFDGIEEIPYQDGPSFDYVISD